MNFDFVHCFGLAATGCQGFQDFLKGTVSANFTSLSPFRFAKIFDISSTNMQVSESGFRIRIRIRIRSEPVFLHGSGSRSGFQISLDPDLDPVSAKILENCRKVSKSDLSEENLKFRTKDRKKMKKATISY